MSMISNQVDILREKADMFRRYKCAHPNIIEYLEQAADIIGALSVKLSVANMERSERFYNGTDLISKNKLLDDIKQKLPPERFGERCDALDVLYAVQQVINEQKDRYYGGGWIPVTERLPEMTSTVLIQLKKAGYGITGDDGNTFDISYLRNGKKWVSSDGVYMLNEVIAWKPIQSYNEDTASVEEKAEVEE